MHRPGWMSGIHEWLKENETQTWKNTSVNDNTMTRLNKNIPLETSNKKLKKFRTTSVRRQSIIETLSTTTGATTTAYRKHIFCSGHAQKLNNWLQSAVVLTLTTPHSLFWRSVDNVGVHCKVFSPFLWFIVFFLTTHKEVPFWCLLLKFFEKRFYNEHHWRRKMRWHKPLVGKFTENPKLEEIHSVRSITFISSVL